MNQALQIHESNVMSKAMAAFLRDAINAKGKHKKIKTNMECRRKLEIKWEQKRLERETSEFDFN
jgi:hypothetical protein